MYSPPAAAPNHQMITPVKATPMLIQTADSMAASFVCTSWASRCTTSRSTSSSAKISASNAIPLPGVNRDVDEVSAALGG